MPRQRDERHVVRGGSFHAQTFLAAIFGEKGKSTPNALARRAGEQLSRDSDFPRRMRIETEQNAPKFGAARAHQTSDAQHLTGGNVRHRAH